MTRQIITFVLRATLLPALIRATLQRRRTTIVVYHDPSPEVFERHVKALLRFYTLISLRDLVEAHKQGHVESLPVRSLVITIDDGHKGNYRLKPVLERIGVPVTIFLCSAIIGTHRRFWFRDVADPEELKRVSDGDRRRKLAEVGVDEEVEVAERAALSKTEIEELKGVVDFQSHTLSHPILPTCEAAKARREIANSRHQLANIYGIHIYALAYPDGTYSERDIAIARASGYECCVTVDPGFNTNETDIFRLKRICIDDCDSVGVMLVKVCGLWDLAKDRIRGRRHGLVSLELAEPSQP